MDNKGIDANDCALEYSESEPDASSTVTFSGEEVEKMVSESIQSQIHVSKDELDRLNSGELHAGDIIAPGGMSDAFVTEMVETFIAHADEEFAAFEQIREDTTKRVSWPHERILLESVDDGTVNEFVETRLSYLVNHTIMQIALMCDALRRNISQNKRLLADAKGNDFEYSPEDQRSIVGNTLMLEELYNQNVELMMTKKCEFKVVE